MTSASCRSLGSVQVSLAEQVLVIAFPAATMLLNITNMR